MKVFLINPPYFNPSKYKKDILLGSAPALSLAYLTSYCKKHSDIDIFLEDMYFKSFEYIEERIKLENPDIIGITCLTENRINAFKTADIAKKINKDIKVILGGHHSTYMWKQVLENYNSIDIIVIGEGEITFLELLNAIENNSSLDNIKGIAFKKNGKPVKNVNREYIKDLDSLPFPDYSFFNLEQYSKIGLEFKDVNLNGKPLKELKYATVITSRGCPYNCQFCSTTAFWGRKWRFRSVKNVCDEIELLVNKYGIEYINFADDAFTIKPDRVIELCKELLNRKINILWDCTTRAEACTEEMFKWMKKAGCVLIVMGVESASEKILKTIGKELSIKKVISSFTKAKKCGLHTSALLMVGNPGESNETVNETRKLIKKIKVDIPAVSITMVFPETKLFEYSRSKGFIDEKFWLTEMPPPYFTIEHSFEKLVQWKYDILFNYLPFNKKCLVIVRKLAYYLGKLTGYKITRKGIKKIIGEIK